MWNQILPKTLQHDSGIAGLNTNPKKSYLNSETPPTFKTILKAIKSLNKVKYLRELIKKPQLNKLRSNLK